MSTLEQLLSRVSVHPQLLGAPAPTAAHLDAILDAALRAPDHGRLRPWRFLLIRGVARARRGEVFAAALAARDPGATEPMLQRECARPLSAPLVIAIAAEIRADHPVPEIEQLLSTGAAAMNMLNAIHALGYGGMWVTGANAYDPNVRAALGLNAAGRLVGFLYVGTPVAAQAVPKRPDRMRHVVEWTAPVGDLPEAVSDLKVTARS
ncbi:MAG TPA: nitroreductase [Dongiaceae bacterium]|jgi:nitroreductase|nr:nitroreductase [Dongiaceae bacterium]